MRLLPWTATLFFVAPVAGALVERVGERVLIATGLLLQAAGLAWIAAIAAPDLAYGRLVAPLILAGCGISMAMPATQNVVMNAVRPEAIGQASGTYNSLRQARAAGPAAGRAHPAGRGARYGSGWVHRPRPCVAAMT
jgi:MFS family permease